MSTTEHRRTGDSGKATTALLEMDRVTRSYGEVPVVRGVSLGVEPGRCVALMGSNGAGKSTVLRLAAGRERPTSGRVLFAGEELDGDRPRARSGIATVLDPGAFYPDLTVREHLMLVALAHGLGDGARDRVAETLEDHHLADHADLLPSALSSGLTQQLLLAAAFVRPHELLVLDEPEQRLDAGARRELAERLARHKERGTAILMATHQDRLAEAVADSVVVLDHGIARDHGQATEEAGDERAPGVLG
ncbi:ABC transporter ATP-binding protein [Streptomyces macrosporus]